MARQQGGFWQADGGGQTAGDGESPFTTVWPTTPTVKRKLAAWRPTGKILAMDLSQLAARRFCQKDAFLCAARAHSALYQRVGVAFRR
jgi:uncharacterized protein (AIM24 family)